MKLQSPIQWWTGLDERKRAGYSFIVKLLVAVLTLMTAISVFSYLFSWKADQSLIGAGGGEVANAASKGGFSLGRFLVTDSFGLAAFVIVLSSLSLR